MIVKKAKYKNVKQSVRKQVSPDIFGCDECTKELGEEDDKLEITVFYNDRKLAKNKIGDDTDKYQFCCWECMGKFLPKIKCDYFISLPFLHYDTKTKGTTAKDFIKLVNRKK